MKLLLRIKSSLCVQFPPRDIKKKLKNGIAIAVLKNVIHFFWMRPFFLDWYGNGLKSNRLVNGALFLDYVGLLSKIASKGNIKIACDTTRFS